MKRILIVENESKWEKLLRESIKTDVIVVETASSLDRAKVELEQQKYDVLVADLKLSESQRGLTNALSDILFVIKQDNKNIFPRPIIIVTGYSLAQEEIVKILNDHPGWIWGWHEKDSFDADKFHRSVLTAVQAQSGSPVFPGWWRLVLTVVGFFILAAGVTPILARWLPVEKFEPWLTFILNQPLILGLVIIMLAYPDKIADVLPFIRKKD